MTDAPILVFDSGVGGLTVLREARVLMPDRRFVYVADDAGFPYGNWEEEALKDRLVALFGALIDTHAPLACVIACNTASTLALDVLRQNYPSMRFVGTVPAIKPAAERTRSGLVSVLATPGTVKRQYTQDLIRAWGARCEVTLHGSVALAGLAEQYMRGGFIDESAVLAEIRPCFIEKGERRTDIIVLACTHYPFLANRMRKTAPWPVDWLDPAEAIARQVARVVADSGNRSMSGDFDPAVFTSGDPDHATRRIVHGFGLRTE
ncbi:glutamate racemase [Fulvimarina sp. 2208YS6-2-32]|uniref:Glutamate racemase n=1 Tax=Fulvimarina uroteuthidis TaxID=3098149 RepID=A0ABU5I4J7_9HYPH|nr:glutamate racemase [Fulvimarina sp. 2208YS6-2-32]MDY8109704.1 glutamate racemase [Fulvimarina sp. 2208YS6-2-32]